MFKATGSLKCWQEIGGNPQSPENKRKNRKANGKKPTSK